MDPTRPHDEKRKKKKRKTQTGAGVAQEKHEISGKRAKVKIGWLRGEEKQTA